MPPKFWGPRPPFLPFRTNATESMSTTRSVSVAAARADHHIAILLENDVWVVVEVQDRDGGQLGRRAARLWHWQRLHEVRKCLHNSVVGGVHLSVKGKRAFAVAVESRVAFRCDNPILQHTLTISTGVDRRKLLETLLVLTLTIVVLMVALLLRPL